MNKLSVHTTSWIKMKKPGAEIFILYNIDDMKL